MSTDNLEQLTEDVWGFINQQLETHRPTAVAGVMVAQALSIYRTILTASEYDSIVDTISDTRDQVNILTPPELQ